MTRRVLEVRENGARRIARTECPVYEQLVQEQFGARPPTWVVVRGLCNGVSARVEEYRTEEEARIAWNPD